jgi:hypothetical protein
MMLLYSERTTGPEEVVVTYEQREYSRQILNPILIPTGLIFVALTPILLALYYTIGPETPYYDEEVSEYGCPALYPLIFYYAIGYAPCGSGTSERWRPMPVVEEIRQTDRTIEERHPLAQQSVQVKVAAQGAKWQKNTVLTVVTDAEGQQRIPLDSVFKESPNAPQEVTVILTGDEVQTTVHLDSHTCEAIYAHVRK